jgi:hypothetical protein
VTGQHRDRVISPAPSLAQAYFGTEPRRLAFLGAVVLGVAIVVTGGYVLIVGADTWTNDVAAANHLMWAGLTRPGTTACPRLAASTTTLTLMAPFPRGPVTVTGAERPYVCPSCGAIGLPLWSSAGQTICPTCGVPMVVASPRPGLELAAAP